MSFTVSDALKTGWLRQAKVQAGAQGLTREVTSVNVMEVPDILAWVKPHELLLTTLYPLRDAPGTLAAFVTELASHELAGIVVKTGRYFETIPDEMCRTAEQLGLPLIELRSEVSFDEIITDLLSKILSVQTSRLQHSEEVHRRFTAVVLAGGGLQHIAENLALLIANPVVIIAPDRRVLASATAHTSEIEILNASICDEIGQRFLDLDTTTGPRHGESTVLKLRNGPRRGEGTIACYACPIRVGSHTYGSIVALEVSQPFADDDAVTMEHAATVSALTITKEQAILAVERKFQSDFLDDLLAGRITSLEIVRSRSQTLAWNLNRPCFACVAEIRGEAGTEAEVRTWQASYLAEDSGIHLLESARVAARHIDPEAIVVEKSGQLLFILGSKEAMQARKERHGRGDSEIGERLLRGLRFLQRERAFVLGLGRSCTSALQLHQSYKQARQAIAVGKQVQGTGEIIHFNELGFQRILSQFENRAELHAFADEQIGELETYDKAHNADLLLTLEALLNSNLNMAVTARSLHLHYNSLRYRLQKIEELAGTFMDDARQRMNLELALQIRRINREQE